jgi:hypothetical protein
MMGAKAQLSPGDDPGAESTIREPRMQPIVSGTTTERIVRTSIVTVMFLGFSAYSFYDGYVGYPRQNVVARLKTEFSAEPSHALPPISEAAVEGAETEIELGRPVESLKDQFGVEPLKHVDATTSAESYYIFGPGGQIRVSTARGQVTKAEFLKGPKHSEADLLTQKFMGIAVGLVGLVMFIHWLRVVLTRAELNEQGLKVRGKPLVPFDAMKAFHSDDFRKKGWMDLEYDLNGTTGRVRLDDYVLKQFNPILDAICARTGLPDPRPAPATEPG